MIYEIEGQSINFPTFECRFPEALAVIEGNNPGWVFVDDPNIPSAALVWAQGIEGFYLVGDASSAVFRDELNFLVDRVLKPRLDNLGVSWFEISGGENWDPVIQKALSKRDLKSNQQWVHILRDAGQVKMTQPELPDNFGLRRINEDLLANSTVSNKQFLFSKLTHFWGSLDAFLNLGLGYVLVDEEEIVSSCYSGFVAGDIHAIDIETEQSHRRRGYAETAARAFLAECIEKHLQPHWDCMAENIASVHLAEKLGFSRSHEYNLYSFQL